MVCDAWAGYVGAQLLIHFIPPMAHRIAGTSLHGSVLQSPEILPAWKQQNSQWVSHSLWVHCPSHTEGAIMQSVVTPQAYVITQENSEVLQETCLHILDSGKSSNLSLSSFLVYKMEIRKSRWHRLLGRLSEEHTQSHPMLETLTMWTHW